MGLPLRLPPRLARATARVLVLALSVTTVGPMLHGAHDAEMQSPIIALEERDHHLQRADGGDAFPHSDHCVACHFVRSSRGAGSWEPTGLQASARGSVLYHSDGDLVAAPDASPTPARAPPISA
jgi:hypothetical protein